MRSAWEAWERHQPADERALTRVAFGHLKLGHAPCVAECAQALGEPETVVAQRLARMVDKGTATAADGRMTGTGGLSVAPTAHRMTLGGVPLFAWCALDTLGIPAASHSDAVVTASLFPTGEPITLTFRWGRLASCPPGVALQIVSPDAAREAMCGGT